MAPRMMRRLRREWRRLVRALRSLDRQTVCVLVLYIVFVVAQFKLGSRRLFLTRLAPEGAGELLTWGWWFAAQGLTGFVLPALTLGVLFRRRPREIGLGLGDWKLAVTLGLFYLPLVVLGAWLLSNGADFQADYPHYRAAARSWKAFLIYQGLFLFYWIGWEYLWRGFVLFGTAHTLGYYAIFIQAIPFTLLHLQKPAPELALSILGGLALGALVWRCRSFWIAVPLHAAQMLILDFWCTLRIRSGVSGIGPRALLELLQVGG